MIIGYEKYLKNEKFLYEVDKLKKAMYADGHRVYTEKEIAERFGRTTIQLRGNVSLANKENRAFLREVALYLAGEGWSVSFIAKVIGKKASIVRLLLDDKIEAKLKKSDEIPDIDAIEGNGE